MKRLQKLGMVNAVPGMAALDMNSAEDAVVRHTREVVPGMVICGMEVCFLFRRRLWFLFRRRLCFLLGAEWLFSI